MAKVEGAVADAIDVEPNHLALVHSILARHLPHKKVWAYGSRVKWTATERSDLDCVVFDATTAEVATAREAFEESNIPFIVVLLKWDDIPDNFKQPVKQKYFVLQTEQSWRECRLGDVGEVITGKTPSSKEPYDWGKEMPFVTPTDYRNYRKFVFSAERMLSAKGIENLNKQVLPPYSVMVTCIGSDMGRVAINKLKVITNQQINSVVPTSELVSSDFLYYALVGMYDYLRVLGSAGTAVPIVNKSTFERIELILPPLPEQEAIAEVLSSLDDKIDLLHRQNKTLENIAQVLFRHHFIDNAQPDWEEVRLGEIAEVLSGYAFKSKDFLDSGKYKLITIKNVQDGYLETRDVSYFDCVSESTPNYCLLHKGDITLSLTGNVGRVALVDDDNLLLNQRVAKIEPQDSATRSFIYFYLRSTLTRRLLEDMAKGSAQPNLSPVEMRHIRVPFGNHQTREVFVLQSAPLMEKLLENKQQIRTLEKLRGTLLSKLISGKVRIAYEKA